MTDMAKIMSSLHNHDLVVTQIMARFEIGYNKSCETNGIMATTLHNCGDCQ